MALIPLTQWVEAGHRRFQVETQWVAPREKVVTQVLLDGRKISQREEEPPAQLSEGGLAAFIQEVHKARVVELESIFNLGERISEKPTVDACNKIGVVMLANGFYEEALVHFRKSLELDSENLYALKHSAVALALLDRLEEAVDALRRAQEKGPDYADLRYHLGNVYLYRRELRPAEEEFQAALAINPNYADAHLRLATVYVGYLAYSSENFPEAKKIHYHDLAHQAIQQAVQINPKLQNRALLMAQDYLRNKKYSLAFPKLLESRERYVPRTGDDIVFYFMLVLRYGATGIDVAMTEGYIEKLAALIKDHPSYADLRHHLALAFLIRARFDIHRAGRELRQALEINPNYQAAARIADDTEAAHQKILEILRKALFS